MSAPSPATAELLERLPANLRTPDGRSASPILRAALDQAVLEELAIRHFWDFFLYVWPVLEPGKTLLQNWHLQLICETLQQFKRGELIADDGQPYTEMVICVPPRSLKSRIVTIAWQAYEWLHDPGWRCLAISNRQPLATKLSVELRNLILSDRYQALIQRKALTGAPAWAIGDALFETVEEELPRITLAPPPPVSAPDPAPEVSDARPEKHPPAPPHAATPPVGRTTGSPPPAGHTTSPPPNPTEEDPSFLPSPSPSDVWLRRAGLGDTERPTSRSNAPTASPPRPTRQRPRGPQWSLAKDQQEKVHFKTSFGGHRQAYGVGSKITGEGGHCLIIDDPYDAEEVLRHPRLIAKHMEWIVDKYDGVWRSRLDNPEQGLRVLVMQRLDEEDLAGVLIARGAYPLVLPMEYDPDLPAKHGGAHPRDPRTEKGQLLLPGRWGERFLKDATSTAKKRRAHASQNNQRPEPRSMKQLFKKHKWKRYDGAPHALVPTLDRIDFSTDASFKGDARSDETSILVVGWRGVQKFLLDRRVAQMDFFATLEALRELSRIWPTAHLKLVEEKANGAAIVSMLSRELPGVVGFNPDRYGSKYARATYSAHAQSAGQVFLPDPTICPWVTDFIDEHDKFTGLEGGRDGQVDSFSQLVIFREVEEADPNEGALEEAVDFFEDLF